MSRSVRENPKSAEDVGRRSGVLWPALGSGAGGRSVPHRHPPVAVAPQAETLRTEPGRLVSADRAC